jgi:hypothetical protein
MSDARSEYRMRLLTPGEAWDIYVGDQSPEEFLLRSIAAGALDVGEALAYYVEEAPMCADLDEKARDTLFVRLNDHARSQLAVYT